MLRQSMYSLLDESVIAILPPISIVFHYISKCMEARMPETSVIDAIQLGRPVGDIIGLVDEKTIDGQQAYYILVEALRYEYDEWVHRGGCCSFFDNKKKQDASFSNGKFALLEELLNRIKQVCTPSGEKESIFSHVVRYVLTDSSNRVWPVHGQIILDIFLQHGYRLKDNPHDAKDCPIKFALFYIGYRQWYDHTVKVATAVIEKMEAVPYDDGQILQWDVHYKIKQALYLRREYLEHGSKPADCELDIQYAGEKNELDSRLTFST